MERPSLLLLKGTGLLSVPQLASVFLNGFAGTAPTQPVFDCKLPEFLKVFCSVPSSTVLLPAPSESALKGSSGESSSTVGEDNKSDGGEENMGGGEKSVRGMPCSSSDVAE